MQNSDACILIAMDSWTKATWDYSHDAIDFSSIGFVFYYRFVYAFPIEGG